MSLPDDYMDQLIDALVPHACMVQSRQFYYPYHRVPQYRQVAGLPSAPFIHRSRVGSLYLCLPDDTTVYATPGWNGETGLDWCIEGADWNGDQDGLVHGSVSVPWTGDLHSDVRIYLDMVADIVVRNLHRVPEAEPVSLNLDLTVEQARLLRDFIAEGIDDLYQRVRDNTESPDIGHWQSMLDAAETLQSALVEAAAGEGGA